MSSKGIVSGELFQKCSNETLNLIVVEGDSSRAAARVVSANENSLRNRRHRSTPCEQVTCVH